MDAEGWWCWISSSKPAGKWNDPAMMNQEFRFLKEVYLFPYFVAKL